MFSYINHKLSKEKGFTLIELLVVIAIIGLLSTLAVIALQSAREKARDQIRLSDLKQIQTALELYYTDKNKYPIEPKGVVLGTATASCLNTQKGFTRSGCKNPHMANVPSDPSDFRYIYKSPSGTAYTIKSQLETGVGGLKSGPVQVTPKEIKNLQSKQSQ